MGDYSRREWCGARVTMGVDCLLRDWHLIWMSPQNGFGALNLSECSELVCQKVRSQIYERETRLPCGISARAVFGPMHVYPHPQNFLRSQPYDRSPAALDGYHATSVVGLWERRGWTIL